MTIEETRTRNEADIRGLVDGLVSAVRAKDINGVMSAYAPELVAFDVVPPLRYVGAEAFIKPWQELFESFKDPISYDVRDLSITAGDDVAFSHSLDRISGRAMLDLAP
jgi:ketosteroid isomerase-like protein